MSHVTMGDRVTGGGRLQLGLSRLRSEVGRMLLSSPPAKRRELRRGGRHGKCP